MSVATADYARLMARYAAWQNESLAAAADALDDAARTLPRGAFFGSIAATLNHLLWGDRVWMARFAGTQGPHAGSIAQSAAETADWASYRTERRAMDAAISGWAAGLTDAALAGELSWYSGAAGRDMSRPMGELVVHFFNHGTHHRGQVHAMLTAAGARPGDTDLFLMSRD